MSREIKVSPQYEAGGKDWDPIEMERVNSYNFFFFLCIYFINLKFTIKKMYNS